MPQEFAQSQDRDQTLNQEETVVTTSSQHENTVDALDAVLDDIETILESNAQEYVSSFVQKGGE